MLYIVQNISFFGSKTKEAFHFNSIIVLYFYFQALQGTVKAGKLDCERYRWVCSGAGVNAYPTVKLYVGSPNGGRQNVNGINFPNLNKHTILSDIPRYLPKNSKNHDEL